MKNSVRLCAFFFLLNGAVFSQDSLYKELVKLPDTLSAESFNTGWGPQAEMKGVFTERQPVVSLRNNFSLIDSLPQYHLYLYINENGTNGGTSGFLLSYEKTETARTTWVTTYLGGKYQSLEAVSEAYPIVELKYLDESNGSDQSAEFEVSAFFGIDNNVEPMGRVVRKIWKTKHGSYDPACRDYRFYSIEFTRDVFISDNKLYVRSGKYKRSSNLDCEVSNIAQDIAGGVFEAGESGFIRKK